MRVRITETGVELWLSARDTYDWAHKPGAVWPCSDLEGKRLYACFDSNGLCDLRINGRYEDSDVSSGELTAICSDFLATRLPREHVCWYVVVGQFLPEGE